MVNFIIIQTLEVFFQIEYDNSIRFTVKTIDESHLLSSGHGCTFQYDRDSEQAI